MQLSKRFPELNNVIPVVAVLFCLYLVLPVDIPRDPETPSSDADQRKTENRLLMPQEQSIQSDLDEINIDDKALDAEIRALLKDGHYKQASSRLLELAAEAVNDESQVRLGRILLLLGEVGIDELTLDSAEMYLNEALEISIKTGDQKTTAYSYYQLGRLYTKTRAMARTASDNYDKLWIIRNQIFYGETRSVQESLVEVIDSNLSIRRYGAAASAYETLADFHFKFNDNYPGLTAAGEAAKLYASSGQITRSHEIVERLESQGIDQAYLVSLRTDLESLYQQNLLDRIETSKAKDYEMLYQYHINRGNTKMAWDLRVMASKSLANTGEFSLYQRQAAVLAVLYNSNFAMDRAQQYLAQASELFLGQGENELLADAQQMRVLIY